MELSLLPPESLKTGTAPSALALDELSGCSPCAPVWRTATHLSAPLCVSTRQDSHLTGGITALCHYVTAEAICK